jgi:zinc transport system substrate-binding protein
MNTICVYIHYSGRKIMKFKSLYIIVAIIFLLIISGCSNENTSKNTEGKMIVYTTVFPLEDFSKKIGGEYVQVESIYPPGVDEHSFEPSQQEIIQMANGDIFFYIGYNLEGFVNKAGPILIDEGVHVIAVGEHVDFEHGVENNHDDETEHEEGHLHHDNETEHEEGHLHNDDEAEHNHGGVDPHIWLDPLYAKQMARTITDSFIRQMPEQENYFEENYTILLEQLDELHNQFTEVADQAELKKFIVSHAAYGYWEERYGIEQISISGLSTSDEPTQKELIEIIDEVKNNKLQYILVEQNVSSKLVDVIKNETRTSVLPVHNLSVLTEEDINNGEDYFSLMNKNIDTLKKAMNP